MELFLLLLYAIIYLIFYLNWFERDLQDPELEEDSGEYGLLESQV